MIITKALQTDLDEIYLLTKSCANYLIEQEVFQWNNYYPSKEVLEKDIFLQQLWKVVVNTKIAGIIVLTKVEDKEYKNVRWLTNNKFNLYVHRLAVLPKFQKKGYARHLMNFAENYAIKNNFKSVRLDTFSKNKRNLKFYEARNYVKLEEIFFPKQSEHPFFCYELVLNNEN